MTDIVLPGLRPLPLREHVYRALLDQVTSGQIAAGTRLRDVNLAATLGVSRTPVREALLRLEQEGFLVSDHRRGFSVRGFDAREIRETYPLVWTIESLALREGFPQPRPVISRLETLNTAMKAPRTPPAELAQLDHEWHETVALAARNSRIPAVLSPLKEAIRRYERAYMHSPRDVKASTAEHASIARALAAGKVDQAAHKLELHWRRGMDAVLRRQEAAGG